MENVSQIAILTNMAEQATRYSRLVAAALAASGACSAAGAWRAGSWVAALAMLGATAVLVAMARASLHLGAVLADRHAGCTEEAWPEARQEPAALRPPGAAWDDRAAVEDGVARQAEAVPDASFAESLGGVAAEVGRMRRASLEKSPSEVRLYGRLDNSASYVVGRESFVFLGGLRASLLQMAHPFVAVGVETHSDLRNGPQRRFYDTFKYVFAMTLGDDDEMVRAARGVRALHDRVHGKFAEDVGPFLKGTAYSAHQPHALLWVAATLSESATLVFELIVRRLSVGEKRELYVGVRRFLRLFGVPDSIVPPTHEAFDAYCVRMWHSSVLTVGTTARGLRSFLVSAPAPWLRPLMAWIDSTTAVMLPPRLARDFGATPGALAHVSFFVTFAALSVLYSLLPGSLRYLTRYVKLEEASGVRRSAFLTGAARYIASWVVSIAIGGNGAKEKPRGGRPRTG